MKAKITFLLVLLVITVKTNAQDYRKNFYQDNVLYVKFKDEAAGRIAAPLAAKRNGSWKKVHSVASEKLQRYREDAAQKFKRKIGNPDLEFRFYLNNPEEIDNVKKELEADPLIERVMYVPIPVNSVAPDFFTFQSYIHPSAGSGINAEPVWLTYNNRGAGIKVCDIEYSFNADHTDLPPVTILGPAPIDPFSNTNHGTAVLGEIASLNDGNGTTGIASDCEMYFAGSLTEEGGYDVAAAITNAMEVLSAGDVILLEQQIAGPNFAGEGQIGLVPVEWYEPFYNAIALAVGQGITVIEAAGNGQQNLDDPVYSVDNEGHYPFLPGKGSGAIIVGGGAVDPEYRGSDIARSRLYYSNYGSSVQLQGSGQSVCTTGYGYLYVEEDLNSAYTSSFAGTSSATPVVGGAVILLQSVYKQMTGKYLSPDQVRKFLISTGQPQQSGTFPLSEHIGPLPDVYAAIQRALLVLGTEDDNLKMTVYPNPTDGQITIASTNNQKASLKIVNSMGQSVYTSELTSTENKVSFDLSQQPKGVYFIECRTATSFVAEKIVIR